MNELHLIEVATGSGATSRWKDKKNKFQGISVAQFLYSVFPGFYEDLVIMIPEIPEIVHS